MSGVDLAWEVKMRWPLLQCRKSNLMKWTEQLNGDCPKRDAHTLHERCDLVCPDLPNVL
jgi:hypothetical protein